jgi:hypothetical protein
MRAYFFQNFYLQGVHAGIQSQHTTAEMFVKYLADSKNKDMLYEWAMQHKTTIVLNGGMQSDLEGIEYTLTYCRWPWASFREDQRALNGTLTNVGVILPEYIYETPRFEGSTIQDAISWCEYYGLNGKEMALIQTLQSKRLMN